MEIKYYSYDEELISHIEPGKIHIFSKSVDSTLAKNRYLESLENENNNETPNIFFKQPKFMGMNQLKTMVFLSDEIVLREEKQVIGFYLSLTSKNKKDLGVESYYDIIDIAANFFNFFKLLKEYQLEEINLLKKWQEKTYRLFLDIKRNYLKFLSEKNYTDPTFIITEKNYTSKSLEGYKEIIIYNKLYFTPLEKWIINKLEEDGFHIILKLQLEKEDFSEEKLALKSVTLGEKLNSNIEIFTLDDDFSELLQVININEKNQIKYNIYDGNHENYKYNSFFNKTKYISDLPIFHLLDNIHKLLSTIEEIDNELAIELHTVVEIIKNKEIKEYYNITLKELETFKVIVNNDYKYLTKYVIAEKLSNDHFIMKIFEDIEILNKYSTLKEWLDKITFQPDTLLKLLNNQENIGKYFEALSEIAVIEELDILDKWDDFFGYGKISEGLLKLILKYLEFKEIKSSNPTKLIKKSLDEIPTQNNSNLLLMNISDRFVPNLKDNIFLFTEQQKKELGIKGIEENRLEEKYNFFRNIQTSENAIILAINNMEEDSTLSPFVEEIITKYNLKSKYLRQSIDEYIKTVTPNNIEENKLFFNENPNEMTFKIENLKSPFKINAYMCNELFNCKYKLNLRYINNLNKELLEVDRNLTHREYGILAHSLFEEVLIRIERTKEYQLLENGSIDLELVMIILKEFIGKRRLKLPKLNEKYYTEIIYKNLAYSVEEFFKRISKELKGDKIEKLEIEAYLNREIPNKFLEVRGTGKADLIIKTNNKIVIIDFKTGNLNEMQLDFYSILYSGGANLTNKYIFNVDKFSLEKSSKIKLVTNEAEKEHILDTTKVKKVYVLEDELNELFNEKIFSRVNKSSSCGRCDYMDICKVGEIHEEE